MVRIDSKPSSIQDTPQYQRLQKLKAKKIKLSRDQEIPPRHYRSNRKRSRKFSCCLFYSIILLVLCVFILALVAKTGIFNIPFFSYLFYQKPAPTRTVTVSSLLEKDELITQVSNQEITFEINENQLTSLLNAPVKKSQDIVIDELQAAIFSNQIEIFAHLKTPVDTYLTLEVLPQVTASLLNLEIIGIKVGNLPLPVGLANYMIDKLLAPQMEQFNQAVKEIGTIKSLELQDTKLIIKAQM